jgi:hypothetical protein|tara:strand:+ start:518 stop:700 length:183 start_codon:yes stop_codon:yes gene_type:complete
MNKEQFDELPQGLRIDILIKWFGIQQLFYSMISNKRSVAHIEETIKGWEDGTNKIIRKTD